MFERFAWRTAAVFLLLLAFFLLVGSTVQKSATVDEQSHLFRGVAYLREGETHFLLGHPLTASAISALPVLTEPNLMLPTDTAAWQAGNWPVAGDLFLWRINDNPQRILFLGRYPVLLATLLLGAVAARWAGRLAGRRAALLALPLTLFQPGVLAYGRIINGDMMQTLFFVATLYLVWENVMCRVSGVKNEVTGSRWQTADKGYLGAAGVCLGMAAASKYNGVVLVPILALILLILALRYRNWRWLLALIPLGAVSLLVVWGVNGFAVRPFPGGPFWDDLLWVLDYNTAARHGAYFAGRASVTGWWFYFPVAFLLKTPLVVLFLLGTALLVYGRALLKKEQSWLARWQLALFLLLPGLVYLLAGTTSALNIGFRYMLPLLPLSAIFITAVLLSYLHKGAASMPLGRVGPLLVGLLVAQAVWLYPHFIPYFNALAGGTQNGWRLLSDSNVDWGQDLPALARWQQETGSDDLFLSYFGTAHPSAYGVRFTSLPSWTPAPEQGNAATQPYNPRNPAPGLYAISVTNLHGVVLGEQRNLYATFRDREPVARPGNSIFIYEVAPDGPPVDVAYSRLTPAQLDAALDFDSNDVRVRWFDQGTSFLWPGDGGFMVVDGTDPVPALKEFWPETAAAQTSNQFVYELPPPPELDWFTDPQPLGDSVSFLGARLLRQAGGTVELLTAWRSERPVAQRHHVFVHALDAEENIVGQWDGMDGEIDSWLPGDVFVQFHSFAVSDETAVLRFATGLYEPGRGVRLGERIVFGADE